MEALRDAGLPDGVCNLVMGPGGIVGDELANSEVSAAAAGLEGERSQLDWVAATNPAIVTVTARNGGKGRDETDPGVLMEVSLSRKSGGSACWGSAGAIRRDRGAG